METELDKSKKLALDIKQAIEVSSQEQRNDILNDLYSKWIITPGVDYNMFDYLKIAIENFDLSPDDLQIGTFERSKKIVMYKVNYLHLHFMKMDVDDDTRNEFEEKFTKIFKAIIDADNAIQSSLYLSSSMTQEDIGKEKKTTKHDLFRFAEMDYDSLTPYQSLLLYLLEQLHRKDFRRYVVNGKGMCYQKITNSEGYNTHAWKESMSILDFVYDVTRKDFNTTMWINLTAAKDNASSSANYLTNYLGGEFEDLVRDRHVFSFNNGIYISKIRESDTDVWGDQWVPFTSGKKIGSSIVSCKLFDTTFEDCSHYDNWFDIIKKHCPNFVQIMNYQQWSEDMQKWMCIFIGRMLYDLGELDNWQILPYLLGQAASGKCMKGDTPIFLSNGKKTIASNIKVGDTLMGDDSAPRKVLTINRGRAKMYRIKQKYGDDYIVNGSHILSLKADRKCIINKGKYDTDDIVDISVDDYLSLRNSKKSCLFGYKVPILFPKQDVNIDTYIVGLLLKEDNEPIPEQYKINCREYQLKLLAGILENDTETINGNTISTITTNEILAEDILFIARCLGFTAFYMFVDDSYHCTITGNICIIPFVTPPTIPIQQTHREHSLCTNIEIIELEEDDYYGFQIDGNQRFILGDHTVTHNSTILENIVKLLYEDVDVGILSNNMEKKFGLSALIGKKIFVGLEIKGNLSLEQAEFQSMISGESVQVNTKFKQAHSERFKVPGMVAGNEVPQYTDNSGSITRRIAVFPFNYKVSTQKGDSKLGYKIQKEIAYIIQACNKGYLDAIDRYGSSGIWEILPESFKEAKELMAEDTNSLTNFLHSEHVIIGKDLYVKETLFVETFNIHCKENHLPTSKWTSQYYSGPFSDMAITIAKNMRRRYPNKPGERSHTGTFILGVDIKEKVSVDIDDSNEL